MQWQNKQPFYHRIDGLLFTSTSGCSEEEFVAAFKKAIDTIDEFKKLEIITDSIMIEEYLEPEPGDPTDL